MILVAPLVGVWIEIAELFCAYHPAFVAPLVGVWIEIDRSLIFILHSSSLPSWECGLKYLRHPARQAVLLVAPLVGVWIEM